MGRRLRLTFAVLLLGSSLPAAGLAQQPAAPPTVDQYYHGTPPGVHDDGGPSSPAPPAKGEPVPNPFDDPNHPLSGSKDPGKAWDDAVKGTGVAVSNATGDWNWGELFYDGTYATSLQVRNDCATPEPVYITHDLQYLVIQSTAVIPPGGTVVPATIKTPPTPPPPLATGAPGQPGYGWVQPPHYDPASGNSVRLPGEPKFHQPNFLDVKGTVEAWHPWRDPCMPSRTVWTVTGHVHFRPPPPKGGDGGPQRIATPDPCVVYWNLGEPPPGFDGRDCTDVFRGLALDTVTRLLAPLAAGSPDDWAWLPESGGISTMTSEELLALKRRIDATLAAASPAGNAGS